MAGADRAVAAVNDRARALCDAVVGATSAVESVFVGGSVARGDVAWYQAEELEIYSDLDLYVVVSDGADLGAARDAARRAALSVAAPAGVRFLRGDDIGVYTLADLYAQPARPGTVGVARDHRVLHGDPAVPGGLHDRIGGVIEPGEGLYLIENRIRELDAPSAPPAHGRLRRYVLMKSAIDVATAFLIGRGRFDVGIAQRRAAIEVLRATGALPRGWDGELVTRAFAAVDDLRAEFEIPDDADLVVRVVSFALAVWTSIAAGVYPHAGGRAASMVLLRCSEGRYEENMREFLAMCARLGRSRVRMAIPAMRSARYAPVAALRVSALALRMASGPVVDDSARRSLDDLSNYLDRVTAACGFTAGSLRERVDSMYRIVA